MRERVHLLPERAMDIQRILRRREGVLLMDMHAEGGSGRGEEAEDKAGETEEE